MSVFTICNLIGWMALITSWVIEYFITDKRKARLVGMVLSAFAVGVFVANGICMFVK
jgi:hypothetical protein